MVRQLCGDCITDFVHRWKHSQEGEWSSSHDFLAVDENLELAVVAVLELYFFTELIANLGRRPGGLNAGQSIPAAPDLY